MSNLKDVLLVDFLNEYSEHVDFEKFNGDVCIVITFSLNDLLYTNTNMFPIYEKEKDGIVYIAGDNKYKTSYTSLYIYVKNQEELEYMCTKYPAAVVLIDLKHQQVLNNPKYISHFKSIKVQPWMNLNPTFSDEDILKNRVVPTNVLNQLLIQYPVAVYCHPSCVNIDFDYIDNHISDIKNLHQHVNQQVQGHLLLKHIRVPYPTPELFVLYWKRNITFKYDLKHYTDSELAMFWKEIPDFFYITNSITPNIEFIFESEQIKENQVVLTRASYFEFYSDHIHKLPVEFLILNCDKIIDSIEYIESINYNNEIVPYIFKKTLLNRLSYVLL